MEVIEEANCNEKDWDYFINTNNGSYRQLYNWGNFKTKIGWSVLRLKIIHNKSNAYIQIMYKKYGIFLFCYIPGGVCGDLKLKKNNLINFLKKKIKVYFVYMRIDESSVNLELKNYYLNDGWKKPLRSNNAGLSSVFYVQDVNYNTYKVSHRNFKKYLKRSKNFNLKFNINGDCPTNDLLLISNYMSKKKVAMHNADEFNYMKKYFKDCSYYCVAYNDLNEPLSYRTIIYSSETAWEIGAATNLEGRNVNAGFAVFDKIVDFLKSKNIKYYHLGGLDKKIPGVYKFKVETGAKEFQYVGEFEYSNLMLLRVFVFCFSVILYSRKLRSIFPSISKLNI
jgi:hypothetical protein